MGLLDIPGISRRQADARYARVGQFSALAGSFNVEVAGSDSLASTPTLTVVGNFTTSGIASAKTYPAIVSGAVDSTYFNFDGCRAGLAGLTFPRSSLAQQINNSNTIDPGSINVEFDFYGSQLEIPWYAQSGGLRVLSDNKEMLIANTGVVGTAQAGSGTTVQLAASGPSATNGTYNKQWVYITAGTGSGSYAQVTGYVGSTKTATVDPATGSWSAPDATSTYEVRLMKSPLTMPGTTSTVSNILLTFSDVRHRKIRIETRSGMFWGVRVGPTDSVYRSKSLAVGCMFIAGDSFPEGTGAYLRSLAVGAQIAGRMGQSPYICASGGTGYLNGSVNARMRIRDRIAPPVNSWLLFLGGSTGGSITLSYGGYTTASIAWPATVANIVSALEALPSVGAGNVIACANINVDGGSATPILFRNALADVTDPLTMTSSLTGVLRTPTCVRYVGDIEPYMPKNALGNPLPFIIGLIAGRNDSTGSNPAYTAAALQAEVEALLDVLAVRFPTATVLMTGLMYMPNSPSAAILAANTAIIAAAGAKLPSINGAIPIADTMTPRWIDGIGNVGSPTGSGNSDIFCSADIVHPSQPGHEYYGRRIAAEWLYFLRGY